MANKNREPKQAKIKKDSRSSVGDFIERQLPGEAEIDYFDKAVQAQAWKGSIDSNLQAIYEGKDGKMIDVRQIRKRRPRLLVVRMFKWAIALFIIGIAAYFVYQYLYDPYGNSKAIIIEISAPAEVNVSEVFSYDIDCRNLSRQAIRNARLELVLPENFILESSSSASSSPNIYPLEDIAPRSSSHLSLRGRIINGEGSVNVMSVKLRYSLGDYSSEFMKESGVNINIKGVGLSLAADYSDTVLEESQQQLSLALSNVSRGDFNNLRVSINLPEGFSFASSGQVQIEGGDGSLRVEKASESSWNISGLSEKSDGAKISWLYKAGAGENAEIRVKLEEDDGTGVYHPIWEKAMPIEMVKSDLSLILIANGSKSDNSVDFGAPIHYSLSYENHGSSTLRDVILVASIKGGFVDWSTLGSDIAGDATSNAILWDKSSLPALAEIAPGADGEINFSLSSMPFSENDLSSDPSIVAYAQFKIAGSGVDSESNRSNTIKTSLNSDFQLAEKILYFDEDNIPVGYGPLPPQAGQTTGFRVTWTIKNNLHELKDAKVVMTLPSYMDYGGNAKNDAGSIYYNESSRQVIWDIGRLPISVYRTDAQFSLSISPREDDRNKILVISSGTQASAIDSVTSSSLSKKVSPRTTKLEDDDIAGLSNSGIIY